jgi:hypothetical protein
LTISFQTELSLLPISHSSNHVKKKESDKDSNTPNFSVINEETAHGNSNEVTSSFTKILGTPKMKQE